MNVYEKVQLVRQLMSKATLKKSGENKFSKYSYYTLDDILPTLTSFLADQKLTTVFSMDTETAKLTVINAEAPEEKVEYTSPVVMASLSKSDPIQALGATHTYLRRYMYLMAFDIVEPEWVEIDKMEKDRQAAERNTAQRDRQARQERENAPVQGVVIPAGEALNFIAQVWSAGGYPPAKMNDWIIKQAKGQPITEEWLTELGATLDRKLTEKMGEKK